MIQVNLKVAITKIYPWIPWELFADPLGSVEHALEITGVLAIIKDLHQLYQAKRCYGDMNKP